MIPQHVLIIKEGAFKSCDNLQSIEFAQNSGLKRIDSFAFYNTDMCRQKQKSESKKYILIKENLNLRYSAC